MEALRGLIKILGLLFAWTEEAVARNSQEINAKLKTEIIEQLDVWVLCRYQVARFGRKGGEFNWISRFQG